MKGNYSKIDAYNTPEAIASADLSQLSDTLLLRIYAMAVSQHYSGSIAYHDWDAPEQRLEKMLLRRLRNSRARRQARCCPRAEPAPTPALNHGDVVNTIMAWQSGLTQVSTELTRITKRV